MRSCFVRILWRWSSNDRFCLRMLIRQFRVDVLIRTKKPCTRHWTFDRVSVATAVISQCFLFFFSQHQNQLFKLDANRLLLFLLYFIPIFLVFQLNLLSSVIYLLCEISFFSEISCNIWYTFKLFNNSWDSRFLRFWILINSHQT